MVTREDEAFDSIVEELLRVLPRLDPVTATSKGLHQFDHELPDLSREGMERAIGVLEGFLRKLEAIDASRLSGWRKSITSPLGGR